MKIRSFFAVVALAATAISCSSSSDRGPESKRADQPAPAAPPDFSRSARGDGPAAAEASFQQRCGECHGEIVDAYQRSGMSQTWQGATLPLDGRLDPIPAVLDRLTGYAYQVLARDESIFQVERRADRPEHLLARRAEYLVGSGKHAQAMVASQNGYLTQLPVAWFRKEDVWKLNPGFELRNQRFDRPITPGCVGCHATTADHEVPTRNRFRHSLEPGIDCSRCHGDAERHIAYWQGDDRTVLSEAARMVNRGEFSPARANDVCLQCHLQGDITLYKPGHAPLDFKPGDDLKRHRHDFLFAAAQPEALGVASHGARMLQSRCYLGSSGQLTCIHCHDPHHSADSFRPEFYDSRCASCHDSESCSRTRGAPEQRDESSCVRCHMPQRGSREGIHLVFTDHAIVRHAPPPGGSPGPPPLLAPNAEVELTSTWPETALSPGLLGAAYVMLHESMGPQTKALQRATHLLSEALRQSPEDMESRYWLGGAFLGLQRGSEALPLLESVLRGDPQRHAARYRLGLAHEAVGNLPEAMGHFQQLTLDAPSWLEPYERLAQLQLFQNQPHAAARTLLRQLGFQQSATAYAQLALAERLSGGTHEAAVTRIAKSIELDPLLPAAYLHRAMLWVIHGDQENARRDFEHVLKLAPGHVQARQGLEALRSPR